MIHQSAILALAIALLAATAAHAEMPRLEVSGNGRHLVQEDGAPFFYLAGIAWELFHRLDRDEAARQAIVEGPGNDYWDHVDSVVAKTNELGLRVGLLPTGATSGTAAGARP